MSYFYRKTSPRPIWTFQSERPGIKEIKRSLSCSWAFHVLPKSWKPPRSGDRAACSLLMHRGVPGDFATCNRPVRQGRFIVLIPNAKLLFTSNSNYCSMNQTEGIVEIKSGYLIARVASSFFGNCWRSDVLMSSLSWTSAIIDDCWKSWWIHNTYNHLITSVSWIVTLH